MSAPETRIIHGDALEQLRQLPDNSFDAVVTDPPYGLANLTAKKVASVVGAWFAGDREAAPKSGRGFMSATWDSFVPPPAVWEECLRVLKPGGHLACFAGTRTQDLMGLSIRLAGFEIRDGLAWIYGSGLPKGQRLGRYDPRLAGWSTVVKPALEPIILARKPLAGTVVKNMLAYGTGGLHVDACRVPHANAADLAESVGKNQHGRYGTVQGGNRVYGNYTTAPPRGDYDGAQGRYPTNLLLSHSPGCERSGTAEIRSNSHHPASRGAGGLGSSGHRGQEGLVERRPDTETVEAWDCAPGCQVAAMDAQSGITKSSGGPGLGYGFTGSVYRDGGGQTVPGGNAGGVGDVGGASRFFPRLPLDDLETRIRYAAKAPEKERPSYISEDGTEIRHITVKPLAVMRWLVRLLTPPGGVVLDPFAGSGTTLEAAHREGFPSVGIERETTYLPLIEQRLERAART